MRIQRSNPTSRFTVLPNQSLQDHALSFTARGLLAYLVSLPDGTREDVKTLATRSREGRSAIQRALVELEDLGYLTRVKGHDARGRIRTEITVSDVRAQVAPEVEPAPGSPVAGDAVGKNLKTHGTKNLPTQTPETPTAPVGSGSVEMTQAEKALAGLAAIDDRLHLSAREVADLAPIAELWFERGADARRFAAVLTFGLPGSINYPAGFLRRRLLDKLPPERPTVAPVVEFKQIARGLCPDCERPKTDQSDGPCVDCRDQFAPPVTAGALNDWRRLAVEADPERFAERYAA